MRTPLPQPQFAQTLAGGTHLILGVDQQTTAGNVVPTSCHVVRATASHLPAPPPLPPRGRLSDHRTGGKPHLPHPQRHPHPRPLGGSGGPGLNGMGLRAAVSDEGHDGHPEEVGAQVQPLASADVKDRSREHDHGETGSGQGDHARLDPDDGRKDQADTAEDLRRAHNGVSGVGDVVHPRKGAGQAFGHAEVRNSYRYEEQPADDLRCPKTLVHGNPPPGYRRCRLSTLSRHPAWRGRAQSTANNRLVPSSPRSSCSPRSSNISPASRAKVAVVAETNPSPGPANPSMREASWTATPRRSFSTSSTSPVCTAARMARWKSVAAERRAVAQRMARAGPSNTARTPSPGIFISRPR